MSEILMEPERAEADERFAFERALETDDKLAEAWKAVDRLAVATVDISVGGCDR